MDQAQDKLIAAMVKLFLDDPASALDLVAERKELFPLMIANNSKVGQLLQDFNKVVSLDLEVYSDFAIKNLADAKAYVYFAELVKYANMKNKYAAQEDLNKKALIKKIIEYEDKSKARKTIIKEIKNMDMPTVKLSSADILE